MKMFRLSAIAAVALVLCACTKSDVTQIGCTIETAVVNVVAVSIASQLECTNQAAISASIQASAAKVGICNSVPATQIGKAKTDKPALTSVGSTICETLGGTVVSGLAAGVIPATWGCSAATATTSLQTLVNNACVKAFP